MSIKVMTRVWDHSRHKGSQLVLLLALADHADDDGVCWPATPHLAQKIRMSERQTQRILDTLIASKEIAHLPGNGRGHPSHYAVLVGMNREQHARSLAKLREKGDKLTPNDTGNDDKLTPFEEERVTFPPGKGDIFEEERVTSSTPKQSPNGAPQSSRTPLAQNDNRHDHEPSLEPDHDSTYLTNGGYGMSLDYGAAAAAATGGGEKNPGPTGREPPPPPHSAPPPAPSLPAAIERAGRDWLRHGGQMGQAERSKLLALLGTYGADWLQLGIAAAVDQGGRTLNYLEKMLEGCKQDNRPPGSRKPEERYDRTGHNRGGAQPHQRQRFAVPAQPELTPEQIAELRRAPKLGDVYPELRKLRQRGPPDDSG
jgi:helix-turn-helix protein